jgi:hypothetical protein
MEMNSVETFTSDDLRGVAMFNRPIVLCSQSQ